MFLRPEDLLKYGSCYQGYSFMSRYFPDGVELTELMQHKYMTDEFLHFGFDNFTTSDEEKELYYRLLNIQVDNPASIYHCRNVNNSYIVAQSKDVTNSSHIKDCSDIDKGYYIMSSDNVENSQKIAFSSFVYDSAFVQSALNVTNSINIVGAKYIVDSSSILDSENIVNSKWLRRCKNAEDSYFCADCHDIKHAMFCNGVGGEYLLFNKPVDPKQFELIKKQLLNLLRDFEMLLMSEWVLDGLDWSAPKKIVNYNTQFAAVPKKLWTWLKTLPGYSPMTMYQITFQPHLLEEKQ